MMLHLEAISDEMINVIQKGPIRILQKVESYPVSSGKDKDTEDGSSKEGEVRESWVEKPRSEWTSEEAKRFRLDGQARNIIIRSTPDTIQCKLWGKTSSKVQLNHYMIWTSGSLH